jgi:hypothetical protein
MNAGVVEKSSASPVRGGMKHPVNIATNRRRQAPPEGLCSFVGNNEKLPEFSPAFFG